MSEFLALLSRSVTEGIHTDCCNIKTPGERSQDANEPYYSFYLSYIDLIESTENHLCKSCIVRLQIEREIKQETQIRAPNKQVETKCPLYAQIFGKGRGERGGAGKGQPQIPMNPSLPVTLLPKLRHKSHPTKTFRHRNRNLLMKMKGASIEVLP